MSITRFSKGVSTAATSNSPTRNFPYPDPLKCHVFWDDFSVFNDESWRNLVTAGTSTVGLTPTQAATSSLTITTSSSDDEGVLLVPMDNGTGTPPVFASWESGSQKAWMAGRFRTGEATQQDYMLGTYVNSQLVAGTYTNTSQPQMRFVSADGNSYGNLVFSLANGQSVVSDNITISASTWYTCGIYFNGIDNVKFWWNGELVKSTTLTSSQTAPSSNYQCIHFGSRNGSAAADTFDLDYLLVAVERA